MMNLEDYMDIALNLAKEAMQEDEVPIGALIVKDDKVIAASHNTKERQRSALHHAEMEVIEKATQVLGTWHLEGCTLIVTLEPCLMCTGAIINSRITSLCFGAFNPKGGAIVSNLNLLGIKGLNHYPKIIPGIKEKECAALLTDFFRQKRQKTS